MNGRAVLVVLALFIGFSPHFGWTAINQLQGKSSIYFSQGQSLYNAQDHSKSQQEAIHDFQVQAIIHAVGTFLPPGQMGTRYNLLQDKIFKQPERYVQTYRIFSENPSEGGLYRVAGQVTVDMDLLMADLQQLGLISEEKALPETSVADSGTPAPPSDKSYDASESTSEVSSENDRQANAPSAVERISAGTDVLWVVPEKWDQDWHLPQDKRDPHGLFAVSLLQETQDYDWQIRFPQSDGLEVSERGNVSSGEALRQAREQGVGNLVLGTVALYEKQGEEPRLEVVLRVLDVDTGKSRGEIRENLELLDESNQEGAMEIASRVVPELDGLLRRSVREMEESSPRPGAPGSGQYVTGGEVGEWILRIRSDQQYVYWQELEKLLREQFKSMQVKGLELGPEEGVVRLDGVDGAFIQTLDGRELRGGVQVKVDAFAPESHSVRVTLTGTPTHRSNMQQSTEPSEIPESETPESEIPQTESEQ